MALEVDRITDWLGRLRGRVYEQFKGKPKIDAWVVMVAAQFQELEEAAQSLLTLLSIDNSVGAQLDNIGRIVGQIRAGASDAVFRLYIRARIVANRSKGTGEDLYRVFRALFGALGFRVRNGGNKSFALDVLTPITAAQASVGQAFLLDAKEAGARANFEWQPVGDDAVTPTNNILRWDVAGHGFDVSVWGGAESV